MGQVRLGLFLAALSVVAACGDDDASPADGGTAGGAGGKNGGAGGIMLRDPSAGKGGTGGSGGGELTEGQQCSPQRGCAAGLTCIDSGIQGLGLNICARTCMPTTQGTDCMADEECAVFSVDSPGYCVNTAKGFLPCGPLVTAQCEAPYECLIINPERTDNPMTAELELAAYCLQECTSGATADADAGLSMGSCMQGETCLPSEICATLVPSGGDCTPEGYICEGEGATDTCFPDDLDDVENSKYSCHQLCENMGDVCRTGECTSVRDQTGNVMQVCL